MAVIRGTDKKNKLKGKATNDTIYGLLGHDILDGGAGDDSVYGHDGNDHLLGGLGNDNLNGGLGKDNLTGGDGDDYLDGGYGEFADSLRGNAGNDSVAGNSGNDHLFGDAGNDSLYGGDGKDNLNGGEGNDLLDGGQDRFRDVLTGGAGNDAVYLYRDDVATGGSGFDTLILNISTYDLGTDINTIPENVAVTVNLSKITGKKAADVGLFGMKAGQFEKASVVLYAVAKGSTVIGSKGDDTITVSAASSEGGVTIYGGAGDDKLSSSGNNVLIGGAGSDTFMIRSWGIPDTVQDFTSKDFLLVSDWFSPVNGAFGIDRLNPLVLGADPKATSAKGQFLYDTDDGRLLYDYDGAGLDEAVHVMTLASRPNLKVSSFIFDF